MSPVSSPSLSHEKGAKLLQDTDKGHGEHDLRQKQQGEDRGWHGRAQAGCAPLLGWHLKKGAQMSSHSCSLLGVPQAH